jgi:hypothetical protein
MTHEEQIANLTEMLVIQQKLHETAIDMLKSAIEAEREACAKEADKRLHDYTMLTSNPPQSGAAWSIASAIRARGQA